MNKVYITLYIFLLMANLAYASSGSVKAYIVINSNSINSSGTSINLSNHILTYSSTSNPWYYNLSWDVPYEYNLSNYNITIFNYTQDCDYLEDMMLDIKNRVNNISNDRAVFYESESKYQSMYFNCYSNLTKCEGHQSINNVYKSDLDLCNQVKDSFYIKMIDCQQASFISNQTLSSCLVMKDNYAGQRWIYSFLALLIGVVGCYIILEKPFKSYEGKTALRKLGFYDPSKKQVPDIHNIKEVNNPYSQYPQYPYPPQNMQDLREAR